MFYNILDKKRTDLLPLFRGFKKDFYLAGGTALALHIGHRDSVDFDFFKHGNIDTTKLYEDLKETYRDHTLLKIQEEKNTLSVIVDETVKVSFFGYAYELVGDVVEQENLTLAAVIDIGCMKLSAITGRASNKDYVDMYYILQTISLANLLEKSSEKFPDIDRNLILKSLVYFEDVEFEPIIFKNNDAVDFEEIKEFLVQAVRKLGINN